MIVPPVAQAQKKSTASPINKLAPQRSTLVANDLATLRLRSCALGSDNGCVWPCCLTLSSASPNGRSESSNATASVAASL
jgi:hypothetical protein